MNQAGYGCSDTVSFTFQKVHQWISCHIKCKLWWLLFHMNGWACFGNTSVGLNCRSSLEAPTLLCFREIRYIWFPLSCSNPIRHAPFGSFRQPNPSAEQRWFHTPANNRWRRLWGHRMWHKVRWASEWYWIIVIERVCWVEWSKGI